MNRRIILLGAIILLSITAHAQETTKTCANESGVIFQGVLDNKTFCRSYTKMNFWNAYTWCDAIGGKMFRLEDCGCSWNTDCNGKCPNLANVVPYAQDANAWLWAENASSPTENYYITGIGNIIEHNDWRTKRDNTYVYALCKMN